MPAPETNRHRVRRRSRRPDADGGAEPPGDLPEVADAGPTAARYLADWAHLHGMTQTPTGAILEALASTLDDDDAFSGLGGESDARRVASMCALDFVHYGGAGLAGFAVSNRAVACRDCCDLIDWTDHNRDGLD